MESLSSVLPWIQIILSILLIVDVLLQQSSAGLGSAFGGDSSVTFHTRRGFERVLFIATFVLGALLVISAVLSLVLR
jgi:protein translocase SecG subunit